MRCDQARSWMTTGGILRRWRAARHLARCPRCSEAAEDLRPIVEALSVIPPLTESQRRSWMRAADDLPLSPAGPPSRIGRRLAIAATILLVGLGAWWAIRPERLDSPPVVAVVDPASVKRSTLRELDGLQSGASALGRELDELLGEIDLLDARRDVEALQLQFAAVGGRPAP